jgi:hypothetical protein
MSNDTTYSIKLKGAAKKVTALLEYQKQKQKDWGKWQTQQQGGKTESYKKALDTLMKAKGAKSIADVGSWGVDVKNKKTMGEELSVTLSSWANENSLGNMWISGEAGELRFLQERFPDVNILASFKDEYGKGVCSAPTFKKTYSKYFHR